MVQEDCLHLRAMMQPLFSTRVTYMHSMFFSSKGILIQVSGGTMLTSDVLHGTTILQSVDYCINALLQGKLQSNTLQILSTHGCILVG